MTGCKKRGARGLARDAGREPRVQAFRIRVCKPGWGSIEMGYRVFVFTTLGDANISLGCQARASFLDERCEIGLGVYVEGCAWGKYYV